MTERGTETKLEKWEEEEGKGWEVEGGRREKREEDGEEETLNRNQGYLCPSQDPQFNSICKAHFCILYNTIFKK